MVFIFFLFEQKKKEPFRLIEPVLNCQVIYFQRTVACEQAHRGALAAGREKKGELETTSLEFDYLHRKSRCEMLIGGDDISNDVITLGTCFSMFVYIRARFGFELLSSNLTAQSTGATGEMEVGRWNSNSRDVVQALLPFFSRPAVRVVRRTYSQAKRTVDHLTYVPLIICSPLINRMDMKISFISRHHHLM